MKCGNLLCSQLPLALPVPLFVPLQGRGLLCKTLKSTRILIYRFVKRSGRMLKELESLTKENKREYPDIILDFWENPQIIQTKEIYLI